MQGTNERTTAGGTPPALRPARALTALLALAAPLLGAGSLGSQAGGDPGAAAAAPRAEDPASPAPDEGAQRPRGPGTDVAPAVPPLPDRLVLRAGRPTPPGLTSARATERQRESERARAELGQALAEGDPRREPWLARLEEILLDVEGAWFGEPLWIAAAGAAAGLGLGELEAPLARALDPGVGARRRTAAQLALHDLHGLWFETADEVEAFRAEVRGAEAPLSLLRRQRALEDENRAHLTRLFRYEPDRAVEALRHRDPRLRAAAARVLAESGAARTSVVEALFLRLSEEPWPSTLHQVFASLDRLLAAEWHPDAPVAEWRTRYVEALEDQVERSVPGLELSLARALSGLTWVADGGADPAHGLELVARLLRRLVRSGDAADADVLVGVVQAVAVLSDLARDAEGRLPQTVQPVRLPVLDLLQDATRDPAVRRGAARAAATLALPHDAGRLVDVLEAPGTSAELAFDLLATLRRLAPEVDPAGETAARLAAGVYRRIADADADLRRQALAFLTDPDARALFEGRDPGLLVDRLAAEPVGELRASLLQLLREFGTARELDALLAHPDFDALAGDDAALAADLARTLGVLARGHGPSTLRAAARITEEDEGGGDFAPRLLALDLVADLAPEEAAALAPAEHARVVGWAMAVRSAGVNLAKAFSGDFVERLVRVHLPAASPPEDGGTSPERLLEPSVFHHRAALLLGDLGIGDVERDAEIAEHFAAALAATPEGEGAAFRARVRRDRARFLASRGRDAEALAEYRQVMTWELARPRAEAAAQGPRPRFRTMRWLELGDLRAAARLAAANPSDDASGSLYFGATLVHQPAWFSEPGEVRLQDLRDLLERAEARQDAELLAELSRWLEPAAGSLAGEGGATTRSPVSLVEGLDASPEWGATLAGLRARLAAAREVGRPAAAEASSVPEPVDSPSPPPAGGTAPYRR